MDAGEKRIRTEDDVDRISELPINVRESILDCLPINDAVATSILSSKWRDLWTGMRQLVFDKDFWDLSGDFSVFEYARVIDRILMLHSGPIHDFVLFIPDMEYKTCDINMWLRVLSNNGVQVIEIDANEHKDRRTGVLPMPSYLFRCRELESLCLDTCKLTPPADFQGFTKLVCLDLNCVEIPTKLLADLISRSPLLEDLSLSDSLEEPLTLEAPNLKTLVFYDDKLGNILFKTIPKLICVSLLASNRNYKSEKSVAYSSLELLCQLSAIEELTYDFLLLEPLPEDLPRKIKTPFEKLKTLTLKSVNLCLPDDISFTLILIRSAPSLRDLTIHLSSKTGCQQRTLRKTQGAAMKLLEAEAKKKYYHLSNLQAVKIRGIEGLKHESMFMKILQTGCPNMKNIVIER